MILLQDVSEKQELETRRETLITAIAHDLRNPISAISGFADLIDVDGSVSWVRL